VTFAERWRKLWRGVGVAIDLSWRAQMAARRGARKLTTYYLVHGREPVWDLDPETLEVIIHDDRPVPARPLAGRSFNLPALLLAASEGR
jgi:hypothetical protein